MKLCMEPVNNSRVSPPLLPEVEVEVVPLVGLGNVLEVCVLIKCTYLFDENQLKVKLVFYSYVIKLFSKSK